MSVQESLSIFSRRKLLKSGLWGSVLVVLGGTGLSLQKTRLAQPAPFKLAILSPQEFAILKAVADTLCPRRDGGLPSASDLKIPEFVDSLLMRLDQDEQAGFKLALGMIESPLSGALFGEHLAPFTQLDEAARGRVLRGFRDSNLGIRRTIYASFNALISAQYWGCPVNFPRIGYAGPPDVQALRQMYADNLIDLDSLRPEVEGKGA